MKIYIGNTGKIEHLDIINKYENLGLMLTESNVSPKKVKVSFVYDNGAFSSYKNNVPFNDEKFLNGLEKCLNHKKYCDFAVLPDIVAGGLKSIKFSMEYWAKLPEEINWYLPIQDGMRIEHIDKLMLQFKGNIIGLFVGGTKEWKYKYAKMWVKYAHDNNLKCHIGRVGTIRKLLWAETIGADSIDSTNFAREKKNWLELMDYLKHKQQRMGDFLSPTGESLIIAYIQ